jgi:hypothetical protein
VDGTPSALDAEPATFEQGVRERAARMGLTVRDVQWFTVLRPDIKIIATADDPKAFVTAHPRDTGDLFADPSGLEGTMLVVLDPAGDLVSVASYSTGAAAGIGGLSEQWAPTADASLAGSVAAQTTG